MNAEAGGKARNKRQASVHVCSRMVRVFDGLVLYHQHYMGTREMNQGVC